MMAAEGDDIVVPFLAALQASIAVLLTIFAGVVATQFGLISEGASKEVSKLCVKLFLPALLIKNVGSELHWDTVNRYVPIVIWSVAYNAASLGLGYVLTKLFKLPAWATPCMAFNNTTSLPLLLVQALESTNILDSIDPSGGAVSRAKSYFLVNATIGNSLTFTLGPGLLTTRDGYDDPLVDKPDTELDSELEAQAEEQIRTNEESSLLPKPIARNLTRQYHGLYRGSVHVWRRLPSPLRRTLSMLDQFLNPTIFGAVAGAIIGLVPSLHRLFFNSLEEGGYFNAWLTSAISNIGELFVALQIVVIGVKLSQAVVRFKNGESSGKVPWSSFVLIAFIRFVIWPAISIGVIYTLAKHTHTLTDDPILWFAMMLMPTGPPALNLTALADVGGVDENEKLSIAKFLTMCYAICPLICLAVVGALKACEAAVK